MTKPKRAVLRVDRSPLNERRWALELECGHEEWITSKRHPQRQTHPCSQCADRAAPPTGDPTHG